MRLKTFITLCVSSFIISFPQNIIGCGPGIDAYDYYTSFFNPDISNNDLLRPFYYTGYNFLYDEHDVVSTSDKLSAEWAAYCGVPVKDKDVKAFVTEYAPADISNLYYNIEKSRPLNIPDSVKNNSMTKYFMQQKDLEALGYIIYAKKAEPYVTGDADAWEPVKRDSVAMVKLIKNGQQLYAAAKTDLFKLKYAYQIIRLAHYSGDYASALKFYDDYIAPNKTESILQPLALSLKAGALYRSGQAKEAAYIFSKTFAKSDVKKVSNYLSFNWAVDSKAGREQYLALCKTNEEKANMLLLFALGSADNQTATMKEIYKLDPANKGLETLTGREINKLEENYFTPLLNKEKGGKLFYYTWAETPADSTMQAGLAQVNDLTGFLEKMGKGKSSNPGLYLTAAAYGALMSRNFTKANDYLSEAKKTTLTPKVNDQWMLTNLLLTVNQDKDFNAASEEKILPSVKWLHDKAVNETQQKADWGGNSQWKIFYRNIMSEAIAKKYHSQGKIYKEALAIGAADKIFSYSGNYVSLDFLHNKTDVKDVEQLYSLMTEKKANSFENYLLQNNALSTADVTDFAGTAYLRNYDYENAVKWLAKSKSENKYKIEKDPFIELLYDQEEKLASEKKSTTKQAFAQEMLQLQKLAETDKANVAKHYYKTALGLYNMTYYGHTWELVQYYRSGSDGYSIPPDATSFEKQYYGCYAAHDMFKKAMDASADKNFKAKCLFMMAKCSQKIVRKPQYSDFGNNYDYDKYSSAEKGYYVTFKNNEYFPTLVAEYGATPFYKEAYSRCSYLKDFVKNK
jgi:hypothetical protein